MIADFERALAGVAYLYTSTSVSTLPISNYEWEVHDADSGDLIAELEGATENTFLYAWPYPGNFNVTLTITDSASNTDSETKLYEDQVANIGGGGAAPSEGLAAQKYEDDIEIRVIRVYFIDTKEEPVIEVIMHGGIKFD